MKKIWKSSFGFGLMSFFFSTCLMASEGAEAEHAAGPNLAFLFREINFFILAAGLFFLLRKPIKDYFAARTEHLKLLIEEGTRAREKALKDHQLIHQKLKHVEEESQKMISMFRAEGDLERKKIIEQAESLSSKLKDDAGHIAESELKRAKDALRQTTIKLAQDLAVTAVERDLKEDDEKRLADNYLKAVREMNS